ncbi:copper chaperone PCu(A)C [Actinomadura madurae]|uniref:copper chaperone PCu(A)C n=1 Tax=Actinomadura madurae TaxID=1993 RepID=UPI0020D240C0|nr:copper chaperone PCu(A)C [Actinomadura madurae]MCP9982394.1 copper chaperone PCu(A)C [Actinomadura madurae]
MIRNSRRVVVLAIAGAVAIAPVVSGCGAGEEPQSAAPTQLTEGVNVTVPKNRPAAPQIDLRNMFLLVPEPGKAVAPGTSLPLYGAIINQVKGRADRLVAVSSPAFGGPGKIDGGALALPPAAPDGTGSFVKLLGTPAPTPTPTRQTRRPGGTPTAGATQQPTGQGATPEPTGQGATPNVSETPTSGNTASPRQTVPAPQGGEQPLVVLPSLTQELHAGASVPVTMRFEKAGSVEFQVPWCRGRMSTSPTRCPAPRRRPRRHRPPEPRPRVARRPAVRRRPARPRAAPRALRSRAEPSPPPPESPPPPVTDPRTPNGPSPEDGPFSRSHHGSNL